MAEQWCNHVGAFSALPELIAALGADPGALLNGAGLAPNALDRAEGRISYRAIGRLFRDAAAATRCAHFGLLAGRTWHVGGLGLAGELMRNSPTVGEALRTLVAYHHLNSEGGLWFVLEHDATVDVGYAIYLPWITGTDQLYDASLAAGLNVLRELWGPAFRPAEVFVAHSAPRDARPYRDLFRVQPRFDAEFCALRFPSCWMRQPVQGADPARLRRALAQAAAARRPDVVQQAYRAVRLLLLCGVPSGDEVARVLSLHRRTLNRRLAAAGTSFQEVIDQVRYEVARQLLGDSSIALDDVAAAVGYAGVTQFMRTFRRWAGTTPGRWRRSGRRVPTPAASASGGEHHDRSSTAVALRSIDRENDLRA